MISLDTETTGIDFYHGARPFFITTCTGEGEQRWYEFDVDPLTRMPIIPQEELRDAIDYLFADGPHGPIGHVGNTFLEDDENAGLILQNAKFDFAALRTIGFWDDLDTDMVWHHVRDTLLASHLLASNHPHDLTSLGLEYLGVDIERYEKRLGEACNEARRWCRTNRKDWAIASDKRDDMPSAGEKTWKFDTWLPRAVAKERNDPEDHPYWTVLRDYANADSALTVTLWKVMRKRIHERKLGRIYSERLKLLPIAYRMEGKGITVSGDRLNELKTKFQEGSEQAGRVCVNIASSLGYGLQMPKGSSVNNSLRSFFFDVLKLPALRGKKAKTDAPTLDKNAMAYYRETLDPRTKGGMFVRKILEKRARDTAIAYMTGYQRFWVPLELAPGYWVLHPSLNPTGTATTRWSSSNPNEQNISKQGEFNIRYTFGPVPGREWWSLDAKNIELRIPAYSADERDMIGLFERPDEAPYYGSNHLLNFETVYPDIWAQELKEHGIEKVGSVCKKKYASTWYQWCKNGGFAVLYGAMDRPDGTGTADKAFHMPGAHAKLKARFSRMEALNQRCIRQAEKLGYVETMPDKDVDPDRGYPLLCTRTDYAKILPTVPLNYYSQGTAMWWMQQAMIRVDARMQEWRSEGFDAWLVMQVHDELVLDMPASRCDPKLDFDREKGGLVLARRNCRSNLWRVREIQKLMERGGEGIGVPTPVGCEYHKVHWGEGVTL